MKIHAQGFGKDVEPDAIKAGDLFIAGSAEGDVLCLAFEAKDQRMALILRFRASVASERTPTARQLETLKAPFSRLKGAFAARPVTPEDGELSDFPSREVGGSGDLAMTEDGDLYIAVEEASKKMPAKYYVDLANGDLVTKALKSAIRYSNWELVSTRDSGHQDILARFGGGPVLDGGDGGAPSQRKRRPAGAEALGLPD